MIHEKVIWWVWDGYDNYSHSEVRRPSRKTSSIELLSHWGRVTHICVGKLIILGSDNGLSPGRRQAIIKTNAGILLTGPLRTNFKEILITIQTFYFKKMHLKMSSAKWRPFCLSLNVLYGNVPAEHELLLGLSYGAGNSRSRKAICQGPGDCQHGHSQHGTAIERLSSWQLLKLHLH